jgi:hypothetical protein
MGATKAPIRVLFTLWSQLYNDMTAQVFCLSRSRLLSALASTKFKHVAAHCKTRMKTAAIYHTRLRQHFRQESAAFGVLAFASQDAYLSRVSWVRAVPHAWLLAPYVGS